MREKKILQRSTCERGRLISAIILTAALLAALLAGCAGKTAPDTENAGTGAGAAASPVKAVSESSSAVHVSTAEELLEAIEPGVEIMAEPGVYNLSEWIGEIFNAGYDAWVQEHPFVDLISTYDGYEAVVTGLDDLTICGAGEGVEIVTEPRSADVLRFEYCSGIRIEGLTMGHTPEQGSCTGDVLEFYSCSDISLKDMDLYGCGTYGVTVWATESLTVSGSTVRDCSYGAVSLYQSTDVIFRDCVIENCMGYDLIDVRTSTIDFEQCVFSNNYCIWSLISDPQYSLVRFDRCSFDKWETEQADELSRRYGSVIFSDGCTFSRGLAFDFVTVSSTEELFEAVRPGVTIRVEPGYYNMSEWLEYIWARKGEQWNEQHPYVRLQECYDGVEAVICDTAGLAIIGLGDTCADTELVVEPRYANVLTFENCDNTALIGLTLGHTDTGDCAGSVVGYTGSRGALLSDVDLYGCGVEGIDAWMLEGMAVFGSTVRDCYYGPGEFSDCTGMLSFKDSRFVDSQGGFGFYGCEDAYITFCGCEFGESETNSLYFREDIETTDCIWGEVTEYPDYGDGEWDYEYEDWEDGTEQISFEKAFLDDTKWIGSTIFNTETGMELNLPYRRDGKSVDITVAFSATGKGEIVGFFDEPTEFRWHCDSSNYYANLYLDGDVQADGYVMLYSEGNAEDAPIWLEMDIGEDIIQFDFAD